MIINKRRIRSLKPYRHYFQNENKIVVGVSDAIRFLDKLQKIGFSSEFKNGDTVLPSPIFGPVSEFNAEGKNVKQKDQPMETVSRTAIWHWKQWNGPYDRIPRSKIVDVPYKRYPRSFVPPPSIELKIILGSNGNIIATGNNTFDIQTDEQELIHVINLFLEIFKECQFFTENLDNIINIPIQRLNWKILPAGEMPWENLKKEIEPIVKKAPEGNQQLINYRLETINKFKPNFSAIGQAGFQGYVILGFPNQKIYVLESLLYGNATYVFGDDWKELSKRTKAEILNEKLQKDRIIHKVGWKGKINELFKP